MTAINEFRANNYAWAEPKSRDVRQYVCGHCNDKVSSEKGHSISKANQGNRAGSGIYICPSCSHATYFSPHVLEQFPGVAFGNPVSFVPDALDALYQEARRCTSSGCYTAAVLTCRKMLMNIAVDKGADAGLPFVAYVEYLSNQGFVPPNGRHWVDHIRKKGNEANHEIALMAEQDAKELILFTEMLLKFIYEFPSLVPKPPQLV